MSKKKNELKDTREWALAIIERAQSGDEDAMPALREILDRVPSIREVLGADLDRTVEYSISKSLGGEDNLAFREAIKRKLAALREELEGPTPSPTERLLVDRVVACWFQVQEADLRYAQAGDCSLAQADYHLRRQDRAHRRFLTGMKTLATVRKLGLPVLQVNIGENQVNVANATVTSDAE
ncbi:MAG: hypothetical protein O3C40_19795 [Planctomycetota bacterium]|nr:hypothetical protein [Planctomycetota bacterium]